MEQKNVTDHKLILSAQRLRGFGLFNDLSDEQLDLILSVSKTLKISKEHYLIREGEQGQILYLILEGQVSVQKYDCELKRDLEISSVGPGETVGEMSFIDKSPRSASVKAQTSLEVLAISLNDLVELGNHEPTYAQILQNISKNLNARLRSTALHSLDLLKRDLEREKLQNEMGSLLFFMLIFQALWAITVSSLQGLAKTSLSTSFISLPLLVAGTVFCIIHIHKSAFHPSFYGLTLKNWKNDLLQAIFYTLPALGIITFLKWHYLFTHPEVHMSVFELGNDDFDYARFVIPLLYILFIPLQEFIFRGSLQTAIKISLSGVGKTSSWYAILISSLIFAAYHCHLSISYAFYAFFVGLLWGWIFEKQRSLVGPIASHALVGWWALSILDLTRLMT